jgi:hydrogenase maturation protease
VIGVGAAMRSDDAAGLHVARRLREHGFDALEQEGEPVALLDAFGGCKEVVLVDAVRSGAAPGTIHRLDASRDPLPATLRSSSSTHALGIGEAIELARALGRLPARVLVYGIEGERFEAGEGLSDAVTAAVEALVRELLSRAASR